MVWKRNYNLLNRPPGRKICKGVGFFPPRERGRKEIELTQYILLPEAREEMLSEARGKMLHLCSPLHM